MTESNKLLNTFDTQNKDTIIQSLDLLLSNKHSELDAAVKTRIDCFTSSHSQNNQSTYVPQCTSHRLENPGVIPLVLIEVQNGEYLGEDDIVRFQDDYARANS